MKHVPVPVASRRMADRLDTPAMGLLVFLCLLWGFNQVAIKVASTGFQPVFLVGLRSAVATLLLLAWCGWRRIPLFERDGTLMPGIVSGLLFAGEFLLMFIGIEYTTVSRGILFLYLMPFIVSIGVHFLLPSEKLTRLRVAGMVCAFAGLVLAFLDDVSLPSSTALIGDVMFIGAAIFWGGTTLVMKATRLATLHVEKVLFYQVAVSAAVMLAIAPACGPLLRDVTLVASLAVAYQVVVVAFASYLAWFWLIRNFPATQLSAFTFLTPLFGVMFGALLLDDPLGPKFLGGLALVAIGIVLVNRPSAPRGGAV